MPNKTQWVGIIGSDKGSIMDIGKKKIIRTIPKWSGNISRDGKYTLYAPSRLSTSKLYIFSLILELKIIII